MTTDKCCALMVKSPGMQALIMDDGRGAAQQQGFSESGPMDDDAFFWANWLCENPSSTPQIEWVGEAEFEATQTINVAVTGPGAEVQVNGKSHAMWTTLRLKAGDRLSVTPDNMGTRHYLAVSGRWQVPKVARSASTVIREHLGGLSRDGSALVTGDAIPIDVRITEDIRELPEAMRPAYSPDTPFAVIPGYQYNWFSPVSQQLFFSSVYKITPQIDRMGYRLSGTAIQCSEHALRSEGITLGAIQLPPDGQPIVMMRDRQTLGGYPKLGCVSTNDISRLAQMVPGQPIEFEAQDAEQARATYLLKLRQRQLVTGSQYT
ncbi:biotin-dependent carboxyltransferase family protein [Alteromonas sp. ASW11-19]|uniref:Biotin-dependent carboxyltransferase family protein n=1 Tax=Alteromonas salexigens TaxID=2982530 RepID=A0ABT2VLN8_9ALTE|nr:biotin-dependent carboxyltransferase family protein [Alteromonas salexigens]MCU7553995.1 biotin-dependent carboxyltransferase family protein [Alteromonas salexigens]